MTPPPDDTRNSCTACVISETRRLSEDCKHLGRFSDWSARPTHLKLGIGRFVGKAEEEAQQVRRTHFLHLKVVQVFFGGSG